MIVTTWRYLQDWKAQRAINQSVIDNGKAQYELNKNTLKELASIKARLVRLERKL